MDNTKFFIIVRDFNKQYYEFVALNMNDVPDKLKHIYEKCGLFQLKISENQYKYLQSFDLDSYLVLLEKVGGSGIGNVVFNSVHKGSMSPIELKRAYIRKKILMYMNNLIQDTGLDLLNLMNYIEIRFQLASHGYYNINTDNISTVLYEVIGEKNEDAVLTNLKDFISVVNQLERYNTMYKKYQELLDASSQTEDIDLLDTYFERFKDENRNSIYEEAKQQSGFGDNTK